MTVSNFCRVLVQGELPIFLFPARGFCQTFWKEHSVSLKLRVLLILGTGCSGRFKAPLPPSHPQSHPGSLLNIHERMGSHIVTLGGTLINLLLDTKKTVEGGEYRVHCTYLPPGQIPRTVGALVCYSQIHGGMAYSLLTLLKFMHFLDWKYYQYVF